jgi:hypothetical protein
VQLLGGEPLELLALQVGKFRLVCHIGTSIRERPGPRTIAPARLITLPLSAAAAWDSDVLHFLVAVGGRDHVPHKDLPIVATETPLGLFGTAIALGGASEQIAC